MQADDIDSTGRWKVDEENSFFEIGFDNFDMFVPLFLTKKVRFICIGVLSVSLTEIHASAAHSELEQLYMDD